MTLPEEQRNPLVVDLLKGLIAEDAGTKPVAAKPKPVYSNQQLLDHL